MDEDFQPATLAVFPYEHTVVLAVPGATMRLSPDEALNLVSAITGIFAEWAGVQDVDTLLYGIANASSAVEVDELLAQAVPAADAK